MSTVTMPKFDASRADSDSVAILRSAMKDRAAVAGA
jgi:hypothetical protein